MRRAAAPLAIWMATGVAASGLQLVSVRNEIEIGRRQQEQVRQQVPELRDPELVSYVREVGGRLSARAQGPDYPYSFSIADYREINAFALPGGPVWLNRGAIEAARTEAELAGVLAHEIAHIGERHAADQLTKAMVANGLLGLLGALLGNDSGARAAQAGASLFTQGLFLKFSRDDEREADRVGAELMHRAGWNPQGLVGFMEVLGERQRRDPSSLEVFFSTHPAPEDRVDALKQAVRQLGGGRTDAPRFRQVKERLKRLPPAKRMPRD